MKVTKEYERQPKTAKKPRRKFTAPYKTQPNTSPAKQVEVIALAMVGKKKRQIARYTGLNRETVGRILSMSEVNVKRAEARSILLAAAPRLSVRLLDIAEGIEKNADLEAILAALRGIQVLTNRVEMEQEHQIPERNYSIPSVLFYAKYTRWPTLEEAMEFDKTIKYDDLTIELEGEPNTHDD